MSVSGTSWSNVPQSSYVGISSLSISANTPNVSIDVPTLNVSGTITVNGTAPTLNSECSSYPSETTANVAFVETTHGYSFTFSSLCGDPNFGFSGTIYPGTYQVSVSGTSWSNVPQSPYVAIASMGISSNTPNIALNVPTVSVAGSITVNGGTPTLNSQCSSYPSETTANVSFSELTHGYGFTFSSLCSDPNFRFSGTIYPGTYEVSVSGTSWSNVPQATYVAIASLGISSTASNIAVDVPTHTIAGNITVNGAMPTLNSECSSYPSETTANVSLVETTHGYSFDLSSLCSDPAFGFSGTIYPGTYRISISGTSWSNVPQASYTAVDAIDL